MERDYLGRRYSIADRFYCNVCRLRGAGCRHNYLGRQSRRACYAADLLDLHDRFDRFGITIWWRDGGTSVATGRYDYGRLAVYSHPSGLLLKSAYRYAPRISGNAGC